MLIDSHCHLDFPELRDELDGVLARAANAGVALMVTICTSVRRFPEVLSLAEGRPNLFCTVGLHPHDAAKEPELTAERLVALADHPKVVGIGETGLDFYYDNSPRETQAGMFRAHIQAARRTGLPLIVHTRDADAEMAAILRQEMGEGAFTGVLHCFSSSDELAREAVALGLYISFSGILTFKKAETLRETARWIPAERLLVETDAPYLAPVPMRGRRNEPAFVRHTAERLAALRDWPMAEVERVTTENFHRLFRRIPDPAATG